MTSAKIFLVLTLYFYQANTRTRNKDVYGTDWVTFLENKGNLHYVNSSTAVHQIKLQGYIHPVLLRTQPRFWLYTRNTINKKEELLIPIPKNSSYIPKAPLIVLVHGWLCNRDSDSVQLIKNAILTAPHRNDNVVIMDWSSIQDLNYIISALQASKAADKLKNLVQSLANIYQIPGRNIRFIGHSLGAHVVGVAGNILRRNNLTLSRVTGLDPAGPFFEWPPIFPGISKDSAAFVDIIHTSIGTLGITNPTGHVDFYPGGGIFQPALCPISVLPGYCEHRAAYIYFQKSFTIKFQARKCHDYFMYTLGFCNDNEAQYMGEPCERTARGSYYLDINTLNR